MANPMRPHHTPPSQEYTSANVEMLKFVSMVLEDKQFPNRAMALEAAARMLYNKVREQETVIRSVRGKVRLYATTHDRWKNTVSRLRDRMPINKEQNNG